MGRFGQSAWGIRYGAADGHDEFRWNRLWTRQFHQRHPVVAREAAAWEMVVWVVAWEVVAWEVRTGA